MKETDLRWQLRQLPREVGLERDLWPAIEAGIRHEPVLRRTRKWPAALAAAATLMLAYFVLSKVLIMIDTGKPSGLVLGLLFAIFYFRAMTATFRYHRFLREWKRNPPAPKRPLSEDPLFAPKASDT